MDSMLKSEVICKMPVQEKFVPEPTVTELRDNAIIREFQPACKLPELQPATLSKKFECEYPTVDANVTRIREPLPFPKRLSDVIAWTDAFVDRIATMTAAEEKENFRRMELLANEIERLRDVLTVTKSELEEAQSQEIAAKADNEKTKRALTESETLIHARDATIKEMKVQHDKETQEHQKETADLTLQLQSALKSNKDLKSKLTQADKDLANEHEEWAREHANHEEDHNALKKALDDVKRETKSKKDVEAKLLKAEQDNKVLGKKASTAEAKIETLNHEVAREKNKVAVLEKKAERADGKIKDLEKDIKGFKKDIINLNKQVATAKEAVAKADKDLKAMKSECEKRDKEIKALDEKVNVTEAAKVEAERKATKAENDLQAANENVETLTTRNNELETENSEIVAERTREEEAREEANRTRNKAEEDRKVAERERDAARKQVRDLKAKYEGQQVAGK